jgi:peptide/nickel transport system substrate-binding protein
MKTRFFDAFPPRWPCVAHPAALAAVPKDMLVIGKAADPQTLDPAVTIDNNDWTVTYPSYQRLVKYKPGSTTEVEGDLSTAGKPPTTRKSGPLPWRITPNSPTARRSPPRR